MSGEQHKRAAMQVHVFHVEDDNVICERCLHEELITVFSELDSLGHRIDGDVVQHARDAWSRSTVARWLVVTTSGPLVRQQICV